MSTHYVPGIVLGTMFTLSLASPWPSRLILLFLFYKWGNWNRTEWKNVPKVSQLGAGNAGTWTHQWLVLLYMSFHHGTLPLVSQDSQVIFLSKGLLDLHLFPISVSGQGMMSGSWTADPQYSFVQNSTNFFGFSDLDHYPVPKSMGQIFLRNPCVVHLSFWSCSDQPSPKK